jgi:hypothetical protein
MERTIRWNPDPEEMVKIHSILAGAAGQKKLPALLIYLVLEAASIWILASIIRDPDINNWSAIIPILIAIAVPLSLIYRYWKTPRRIRELFREGGKLAGERMITFTDRGYEWKGPKGERKVPWSEFLRWKEAGGYLFLIQRNGSTFFLPKNKLDPDLLDFIRVKIEENPAPRKTSTVSRTYWITMGVLLIILIAVLIVLNLLDASYR